MTRETIKELTKLLDSGDWMPDSSDAGDLLIMAERALVLEEVLAAASHVVRVADDGGGVNVGGPAMRTLRAAIDRAEGKLDVHD